MRTAETALEFTFINAARHSAAARLQTALAQCLLPALFFLGTGGAFCSMFSLSAFLPLLGVMGVAFVIAGHLIRSAPRRVRLAAAAAAAALLAALAALAFRRMADGMNIVANQIADALGRAFGRIYPHYAVTAAEADHALCATLFLVPVCAALAAASVYAARSANLLLALLALAVFAAAQMATGLMPGAVWLLLLFLSEALLIYRYSVANQTVALPGGGKAILSASLCAVLAAGLALGGAGIAFPPAAYEKSAFARDARAGVLALADRIRYERDRPSNLPEGNFTDLGGLRLNKVPALEVTMSRPDSLYLRGYVGSVYNGDGWEDVDPAKRYESAGTFYRLHEDAFYGQTQLADAALRLDPALSDADVNQITVHNLNASSKYVYAPYELRAADALLLDRSGIGDAALASGGLRGTRDYSYTALPNQVKRYTDLVALLFHSGDSGDTALRRYLVDESHYNRFVYSTYTQLPETVKVILQNHLGEATDAEGEAHASYQFAKQSILNYLATAVSYNVAPKEKRDEGTDFLQFFLEQSCEGYSVHYATAAALMFRYYGIPSRYVEGYLIPPSDVGGAAANAVVRVDGTRAHAWAEIYQDGIGWVPFEVTPPYLNVMEQPDILQGYPAEGETQKEEPEAKPEANAGGSHQENVDRSIREALNEMLRVVWFALLTLAAASLLLCFVHGIGKRKALANRRLSFHTGDCSRDVRQLFAYAMDLLRALGIERRNGSLYGLAPRVEALCGRECAAQYRDAVSIFQEAAFSVHALDEARRDRVAGFNAELLRRIRTTVRLPGRFILRAVRGLY